jgi:D-amino peptidase
MKIFISADIEGITGVCDWDETMKKAADYAEFRDQMTAEVAAACAGALEAGATEILVKDAHDTGRNIIASRLPKEARVVRGWSGHPFSMVQELDHTFAGLILVGYHSRAGADTNPLSHTMSGSIASITINGRPTSEFLLHAYAASSVRVPTVCVTGDAGICREVREVNPHIAVVPVKEGVGNSTISLHPDVAVEHTRDTVRSALRGDRTQCIVPLPETLTVIIRYTNHAKAYRTSFYPGAKLLEPGVLEFVARDFFDVLRLFLFAV